MELEHLRLACELMRRYEDKEPESMLPKELPEPIKFEENKDYIRQVLKSQVNLTGHETEFVPVENLPKDARYFEYQKTVNQDGIPSEQVIEEHKKQLGQEYRLETEGKHPLAGVSSQ